MSTTVHTLDAMLGALTSAGYYVSFTQEPEGYVASVSRAEPGDGDRYEHDAIGDTLAGALAGALPEGFELPGGGCAFPGCGHAKGSHWEHAEPEGPRKGCAILGCPCASWTTPDAADATVPRCPKCGLFPIDHRAGECIYPGGETQKDVQTLSDDMTDVHDRLDALEDGYRRDLSALIHCVAVMSGAVPPHAWEPGACDDANAAAKAAAVGKPLSEKRVSEMTDGEVRKLAGAE